jgi:hypothetical protein
MTRRKLPHELAADVARDAAWFLKFSGQTRPLWQDVQRIALTLWEIGHMRNDDGTPFDDNAVRQEVEARLQARLHRLLGHKKPGPQHEVSIGEARLRLREQGLSDDEIAKRHSVTLKAVRQSIYRYLRQRGRQ